MMLAFAMIDPESARNLAIGVVLFTACISTAAVLYPLARGMARRLEGRPADEGSGPRVGELSERVNDLEAQVCRMHELEERLDFAERMLAGLRLDRPAPKRIAAHREAGADTPPEPVDVAR